MAVKHIEDYYDQIMEKFPDIKRDELDKMLKHCMQSMYMLIAYGADILLKSPLFTMYFGRHFKNDALFHKYYLTKWKIKRRIKWRREKRQWDGYYYFHLTEEQQKKYIGNKKGRLKKKIVIGDSIVAYKIPEECFDQSYGKYYYKVAWPQDEGFSIQLQGKPIREVFYVGKRTGDKAHPIEFVD